MTGTSILADPILKPSPPKYRITDLRSSNLLARWPVIGLLMVVFGSLAFAGLTINLWAQGPLLALDKAIANTLPAIGLASPPFVEYIMLSGYYLGKEVIMGLSFLLGVYYIYKRIWQELAMITIGWIGYAVAFNLLSMLIGRPRPPTQIWIIVHIPGFPSGHAISAVMFYALIAYFLVPRMPSTLWKVLVITAALSIIGFIGFSRIFTAGHYLTDILAGYSVGVALFGAIYTCIEIAFQKKRNKNVKKE